MAAGHLVTRLQATLHSQVNLDHLQHTGWQLVALGEFFTLLFEREVKAVTGLFHRIFDALELAGNVFVCRTDVEPVELLDRSHIGFVDLAAFGQFARATVSSFTHQEFFDTVERVGFNNAQLVIQVETETLQLIVNDLLGTLVTHDAFTGEDLHVDHGTLRTLAHAQRCVFHIAGFFAEDGAQQFFFWCECGLAFWCDLADQCVARLHFSTDINDAGVVQTVELLLSQVWNVAGNFFCAQLGVTRHHHEFFDVDGGVAVFSHHTLADQNRVFKVVTVPRHERDQHVLAQGQFTEVGRCAVSNHVQLGNFVAAFDDRALVDVGVLVGALVFDEVVDVYTDFTGLGFCIIHTHHDTGCVNIVDYAAAACSHHSARVDRRHALDTGTDKRFFSAQNRHRLALHVRTHQRAVRVVVLEERHE